MYKSIIFIFFLCFSSILLYSQSAADEDLAYQYYQNGEYEKASVLLDRLFTSQPNDSYFELYYQSLLKIKKYNEAEKLCKKLIKQFPNKFNYQIALGKTLLESGKPKEAEHIFDATINKFATDELQTRLLANNFYQIQDYGRTISTFLHGRKSLKNDKAFGMELLSIYRAKKDKSALINEYVNMIDVQPQIIIQAKNTLGLLLETYGDYQQLQISILKKLQKEPQNEALNELLIWQYIQKQEYENALKQLIAKDKRNRDASTEIYNIANTFVYHNAFKEAIKAFEYIVQKGTNNQWHLPSSIRLINTKYQMAIAGAINIAELPKLATDFANIIHQYGINHQTVFAVKKLANLQAYFLHQLDSAAYILEKAIERPSLPEHDKAELKIDLGDIYVLNQQNWDAFLVYEQVAKSYENTELGQEALFKSAQLSFYQGNFDYAKSQADVLKNSTSQLIANDALKLSLLISEGLKEGKNDTLALQMYANAQLSLLKNDLQTSIHQLDSISTINPSTSLADDILFTKYQVFFKQIDYQNAAIQLQTLIEKYPESIRIDEAIFYLAKLYELHLNKLDDAKNLYQKIIIDYPGSMIIDEARLRFRKLRGDNIGV